MQEKANKKTWQFGMISAARALYFYQLPNDIPAKSADMKTPAEYLDCPVFELTYPTGEAAESVPVVAYHDAVQAVEAALADAEKYKYLLMRALRRHASETKAAFPVPVELPLPEQDSDTPVLPFYSGLAA